MTLSAAGYAGLFTMLVGIILVILGVVFYEQHLTSNKNISWWVWTLLIVGIIATIVGMIITIMFLRHPPEDPNPDQVTLQ